MLISSTMDIATYFGLTGTPFSGPASAERLLESGPFRTAREDILAAIGRGARLITLIGEEGMGKELLLNGLETQLKRKALSVHRAMTPAMAPAQAVASADILLLDETGQPEAEALAAVERLATRIVKPAIVIGATRSLFAAADGRLDIRLEPLGDADARGFILQAMQAVGGGTGIFSDAALDHIIMAAEGLPRRLRILSTNALFDAAFAAAERVESEHVNSALSSLPHMPKSEDVSAAPLNMTLPAVDITATPVLSASVKAGSGIPGPVIPIAHPTAPPPPMSAGDAPIVPMRGFEDQAQTDRAYADQEHMDRDELSEDARAFPWSRIAVGGGLATGVAAAVAAFLLIPADDAAAPVAKAGPSAAPPVEIAAADVVSQDEALPPVRENAGAEGKAEPEPPLPAQTLSEPATAAQSEQMAVSDTAAEPAEPEVPDILIRYTEGQADSVSLARDVAALLRARGYNVRDMAPAPFGVGRASTRYFAAETSEAGEDINRALSGLLMAKGHDRAQVMDMTSARGPSLTDVIEIWVPGTA